VSLVSADVSAFEAAARERTEELSRGEPDAAAIAVIFAELSGSTLANNEKSRRAVRIAELLPRTAPFRGALASAVAGAGAEIRAAVVGVLPAEMQRAAYTGEIAPHGAEPPPGGAGDEARAEVASPSVGEEGTGEGEDWRSVLLLGSAQDVAANAQFLRGRGLKPVRVAKPEDIEALGEERVCGLVIHRSWWATFDNPDALLSFVKGLIYGSNLLYVKLDCRGLGEGEEALAAVLDGCDAEVRTRISAGTDSTLTHLDAGALEEVAALLGRAGSAQVGVEGLREADRRLLASAVESFATHKHLSGPHGPEQLTVQPILGGRSGAMVLRLKSAAYRAVFVAKLDTLERLQDELGRTRRSTPPGGPLSADMCLYSLDGKGVLIQQLLADLDRPEEGAVTLKERLAECMAWERGRRDGPEPQLADLEVGVDRTVATIAQVNRAAAGDPDSLCWMRAETLEYLEEIGVHWEISSAEGNFDPAELVGRAEDILSAHSHTHVVHGDMNTSNLVMPDDRTPNLIDFALAGAGHPCFDFVRFSSGVAYEFLRPVRGEEDLRRFFARLHLEGASKEELRTEFPGLLAGVGPSVALHALTECRRLALAALPDDGEDLDQYLAMVFLIAAQSLTIEGFQVAAVRSTLGAIAPRLKAA
jgi:Phosphotransferase enzyme family